MNGTIVAAQVESIATRVDNSLKVGLGLQEISPSKAAELLGLRGRVVAVYISPKDTLTKAELDQVDAIDPVLHNRTQSQRMRDVLFVLWKQVPEGYKSFDDFYRAKTEAIIADIKSKIPQQY